MPDGALPIVLNPAAGRGRAQKCAAAIGRLLADHDIAFRLVESTAVGDVERKARELAAGGAGRIVVAGGDGSIHEAVNGIMQAGGGAALGVIPLGTGNDFAKAAAVPLEFERATRLLAGRLADGVQARRVDLGQVNDRYFANSVGIGFDARINEIARGNRLPGGALNYLVAVFQGMWEGVITPAIRMEYDGAAYSGAVTLVEACNGATVGGMFRIAPAASNHDGLLDLVFVAPVSRWRIVGLLPRLLNGSHLGAREVSHARVTRIRLVADRPVPAHLDGEVQPHGTEFSIGILPGALQLI